MGHRMRKADATWPSERHWLPQRSCVEGGQRGTKNGPTRARAIGRLGVCASAAALPLLNGARAKRPWLGYAVRFVVIIALFLSVVPLLNKALDWSEPLSISISLGLVAVYAAAITVMKLCGKYEHSTEKKEEAK